MQRRGIKVKNRIEARDPSGTLELLDLPEARIQRLDLTSPDRDRNLAVSVNTLTLFKQLATTTPSAKRTQLRTI
jgi:hypothetical protein